MPDTLLPVLSLAFVGLIVYVLVQMYRSTGPAPPIDADGWTIVVDGSNFAHWSEEDVRLAYLTHVLEPLERRIGVPLLRVERDPPAVRLANQVDIYQDHERAATTSVDELIESG